MTDKVLSMLSIAMKAGRVSSGETQVLNSIRSMEAFLVICACDASDLTRKKFRDKSSFYQVPYVEYGDKASLARTIGRDLRSVVSVNDEGIANNMIKRLEEAEIYGK